MQKEGIVRKKRIAFWVLMAYWVVLFLGTTLPSNRLPGMPTSDKLNHFAGYAVLAFLTFTYFRYKFAERFKEITIFQGTFVLIAIYGILDELHQIPIPGRYFEWYDVLADVTGALIGLSVAFFISRTFPRFYR